jgi:hypothetical protein
MVTRLVTEKGVPSRPLGVSMRSNGDGERFVSDLSRGGGGAEPETDDHGGSPRLADRQEHDEGAAFTRREGTGSAKGAKPRSKKAAPRSTGPKSVRAPAAAPVVPVGGKASKASAADGESRPSEPPASDRASKRPPPKRTRKSVAPAARPSAPPSPAAPLLAPPTPPSSIDPKITLRDLPAQRRAAETVRATAVVIRREDDASIPPTSTDPPQPGDLDERFFAEGEAAARAAHAEALRARTRGLIEAVHGEDAKAVVVVPPERRRRLTNYVKLAVACSGVLLLAAAGRVGLSHLGHGGAERSAAAAEIAAPPPAAPAQAVAVAPAAPQPPAATQAAPAPAPAAIAAATPEPTVANPATTADHAARAPSEPAAPAKSAKEEKEAARIALERGKRKDAIEAAQRSVDLDPTDAEAWLLLGSAQQDSGHWKEARESFVACTKQGKKGPIGECRMMLR